MRWRSGVAGVDGKGQWVLVGAGEGAGWPAAEPAAAGLRAGRRNRYITGTTYSSQATASSHVVAGLKLKMPLSSVPYQLSGGTWADTSKARLFSPGRSPASWRSWTP